MGDLLLVVYMGIAAIWITVRLEQIERDPRERPGGGVPAVVLVAALWPLVVALMLVAFVAVLVDAAAGLARGAGRRRRR